MSRNKQLLKEQFLQKELNELWRAMCKVRYNAHKAYRHYGNIRKAMAEEGYFGWDESDQEYINFQQKENALWRTMADMFLNAHKAYGHYDS